EPRDVPPLEREVGRLLRPLELRRDAEVDPLSPKRLAEQLRLLDAFVCERAGEAGVAVHRAADRELALGMAREDPRLPAFGLPRSPYARASEARRSPRSAGGRTSRAAVSRRPRAPSARRR